MSDWLLNREGPIAVLAVNRPKTLNAVTLGMYEELIPLLDEVEADPNVRVLVLRGAGERAFVAGADIGEFEEEFGTPEKAMAYDRRVEAGTSRLAGLHKPTVAMIHGYALGTGVFLAVACDLRIASNQARFAVPVGRFGIMPSPPDLARLARVVGYATALEMGLTARTYTAHEALAMGLVNQVVPAEQLETVALTLAGGIAENAPLTLIGLRAMLQAVLASPEPPPLEIGDTWYRRIYSSQDCREGARAFAEKRPPRFQGR